jgi:tetratricopeptide (TPR) repeat protein
MPVIAEFNDYFESGNWEKALDLISYFLSAVRYELPEQRFFYSWIIKAECERETGRLVRAEESIHIAADEKSEDPIVLGAFGYLHMRRRDFSSAAELFTKALACCGSSDKVIDRFYYIYPLIGNSFSMQTILPGPRTHCLSCTMPRKFFFIEARNTEKWPMFSKICTSLGFTIPRR